VERAAPPPRYVDVSASAGLVRATWCGSPSKDHLLESVGSGAAFVDLDGDRRDDILVLDAWRLADAPPGGGARAVLSHGSFAYHRNRGDGTFEDWTERAGLSGGGAWACGVVAGDIDGDGDLDLFVHCFGPDLLFRNRGDGTFEEVAAAAGVADPGWGGGAAFFDAEGDGDLDLYLSHYMEATLDEVLSARRALIYKSQVEVMVGPFGLTGAADRFYRNRGDGTFEEATAEAGLTDVALGYGLAVVAADLDEDGDADIYVANDSNPNYLYRNEGGGRFREVAMVSGAAFNAEGAAQASMGLALSDFDGDGNLDLFSTHFSEDSSTLYRGEGQLFFSDITHASGIHAPTYLPLSWGAAPVDFDQDGRPDILIANGHIYPQVSALRDPQEYRQHCLLLLERGGRFEDGSTAAGLDAVAGSFRGLAVGDIEGDGDPDLLLTRIDEPPVLLRADGGDPGRWLVVEPEDRFWPRWIGTRIDVHSGGRRQTEVILSGGSYASQSDLRARFALGDAASAERVIIRFPGGERREFEGVRAGTVLRVAVPH
jgi:hypothetical protein